MMSDSLELYMDGEVLMNRTEYKHISLLKLYVYIACFTYL